jgi:hypothetical protein
MKLLEFVLVLVAGGLVIVWRGVQLYNTGIKRKRL